MKYLLMIIGFVMIVLGVVGCSGDNTEPLPGNLTSPISPLQEVSLLATPTQIFEQIQFSIDKPLLAGVETVSGYGSPEVPIQVVDITGGGIVLGGGSVDIDGHYKIRLASPIEARHLIGIQLAVPKDPSTWEALWALRGEDARAIPQIGDFFDTSVSE